MQINPDQIRENTVQFPTSLSEQGGYYMFLPSDTGEFVLSYLNSSPATISFVPFNPDYIMSFAEMALATVAFL